jgi:hypothetical protein
MANRILTLALAAGTALGLATLAHAQGSQGKGGSPGQGASQFAPGHSTTNEPPGQGGSPPGQMMNDQKKKKNGTTGQGSGTTGQGKGASEFAPGRSANPPPGQGGTPPGQMMNDQKKKQDSR